MSIDPKNTENTKIPKISGNDPFDLDSNRNTKKPTIVSDSGDGGVAMDLLRNANSTNLTTKGGDPSGYDIGKQMLEFGKATDRAFKKLRQIGGYDVDSDDDTEMSVPANGDTKYFSKYEFGAGFGKRFNHDKFDKELFFHAVGFNDLLKNKQRNMNPKLTAQNALKPGNFNREFEGYANTAISGMIYQSAMERFCDPTMSTEDKLQLAVSGLAANFEKDKYIMFNYKSTGVEMVRECGPLIHKNKYVKDYFVAIKQGITNSSRGKQMKSDFMYVKRNNYGGKNNNYNNKQRYNKNSGDYVRKGLCRDYNNSVCDRSNCKYKHICNKCDGLHPQSKCPGDNTASNQSTV